MASPLAEEYQRKAKEADALAEAAKDQEAKQTFLEVAEQWRQLARWAERHSW